MLGLALVAHLVIVWPGAPGADASEAEARARAAGHQVVAFAPVAEKLVARADAARAREAAALAQVEKRLDEARARYVSQRFDEMAAGLESALDEGRVALSAPAGCPMLWEVAFQLGLAHARRDPDRAARFWALALAIDGTRRPDRALYGPDVAQRFAVAVDEQSRRARVPATLEIEPPDARAIVDCQPVVDPARPLSLRPGLHVVRASAPGYAPAAALVEGLPPPLALAPDGGDELAVAWSEGTLSASSPAARRAMLAAAAPTGATHVLFGGTLFSAAGAEPLEKPVAAVPPAREKRSVVTRWWFWTGVGAAVAGAVVLGVVLSNGGGDQTDIVVK